MTPTRIFLAVPTYDGWVSSGCVEGLFNAWRSQTERPTTMTNKPSIETSDPQIAYGSLLGKVFNQLWVQAVLGGYTHFAMIHADMHPEPGWLSTLMTELDENCGEVISAVVAIKDHTGGTSTAVDCGGITRLQVDQCHELGPTFGRQKLLDSMEKKPECEMTLLVNTGLMLCKLNPAWVRKVCFNITTLIDWEQKFPLVSESEDWAFSRMLDQLGYGDKVFATTKVRVMHEGREAYNNWPS